MGHLTVGRTGFLNTEPALQRLLAGGVRPMHRFLLEATESSHDTTGRAGSIWDISFSFSAAALQHIADGV
jgi:hypothetical protein